MSQAPSSLSLVIPLYNEENRIEIPVPEVFEYCSKLRQWEVIFVDDGSTDGTHEKLLRIQRSYPSVRIVRWEKNIGKGNAVRSGMRVASCETILFSDADFSTPISEVNVLYAEILKGVEIAIGSRGLPNSKVEIHQRWYREMAGKIGNLLTRALLPLDFDDTQCGFKMMTRKALEIILPRLNVKGFAFDIEMLVIAQQHRLPVSEVSVIWRNVSGSKVQAVHNLEVLRDLLRIRYRLALNQYT